MDYRRRILKVLPIGWRGQEVCFGPGHFLRPVRGCRRSKSCVPVWLTGATEKGGRDQAGSAMIRKRLSRSFIYLTEVTVQPRETADLQIREPGQGD